MAEEHTEHLVERRDNKRIWFDVQNCTTNHKQHTERKTTSLAWTCSAYGSSAHTTASTVLASTRIQERTRSSTNKLEEHSQQRLTKDGVHLGRSRGGGSRQTRMTSESGSMCPVGCGMNQGQRQVSCILWAIVCNVHACLMLNL